LYEIFFVGTASAVRRSPRLGRAGGDTKEALAMTGVAVDTFRKQPLYLPGPGPSVDVR